MMSLCRLLVVDDSPTVRKLVELTFRGTSWRVEFAGSGGEGLRLAKQSAPDVVLLDFVLPDMRGLDVCDELSKDDRTSSIPVVVMSGKGESVTELFRGYPSFVACLAKPSTSDQIRAQAEAALARRARTRPSPTADESRTTFKQKEAAAKALFPHLRDALAHIPQWMAELGAASPATYFARKLLTPDLVGKLVDALTPHVHAATSSHAAAPGAAAPADASLHGAMTSWPVAGLLTFFESSARTGELTLGVGRSTTMAYLRAGEVIFVTNRDPAEYLRGSASSRLGIVPQHALQAAREEHIASGTPLIVGLAAGGHFPLGELTEVLRTEGRRLLLEALDARSASFAWRDLPVLPAYVEAHGRHISIVRNTLVYGSDHGSLASATPLSQMALERLRQTPPLNTPAAEAVYARSRGFSTRVQQFTLTAGERRVLTLVDGEATGGDIAARCNLEVAEVMVTLARLAAVELLRLGEGASKTDASIKQRSRSMMILEPDVEGFQRPLASLLRSRAEPVALVDLAGEVDLVGAVRREHPRAVILNAGAGLRIGDTARSLRGHDELSDVALVAVLDAHMASHASALSAAGFDTVLIKPVAYSDLERLLQ